MTYNFDLEIDRSGTSCVKWEFLVSDDFIEFGDHAHPRLGQHRHLPLWVADMDFQCPAPVIEALEQRARQGVFGYTMPTPSYYQAVIDWMARRHHWPVDCEWMVLTPGVVPALFMLVRTFVAPGEKVLIQQPVYHQFMHAIESNGAVVVSNSLRLENGVYRMDFEDLAQKAADPAVRMAILCSPHNPVGRVWSADELREFGRICLENDVLVVSDEIHGDLILAGNQFVPYATLGEEFARHSIICTAPSKSFNLAGLKTSNVMVVDPSLREAFRTTLQRTGLYSANAFGVVATEAAYTKGEDWLAAALAYIEENFHFLAAYLEANLPQLRLIPAEGTYLAWVDCRRLNLSPKSRKELFRDKARVLLEAGENFGPEGEGFERLNLACPRSILAEALDRLAAVIKDSGRHHEQQHEQEVA
jgi:cysteine-S-conjugate beta-lyase